MKRGANRVIAYRQYVCPLHCLAEFREIKLLFNCSEIFHY
jgi:hypothetical protein